MIEMIAHQVDAGLEHDLAYIAAITGEVNNMLSQLPTPPSDYRGDQVLLRDELERAQATLKSCLQTAENLMKAHHVTQLLGNAARHEAALAQKGGVADAAEEEKARKDDTAVDEELKERAEGMKNEYGIVVGNLGMVLDGLKDVKPFAQRAPSPPPSGSTTPTPATVAAAAAAAAAGRPRSSAGSRAATPVGAARPTSSAGSRAATPVGAVRPLNVGKHSPGRPQSRQSSSAGLPPPSSPVGGGPGQMSALERAKLRNQGGGSVAPYL